jgi:hypothetical protein
MTRCIFRAIALVAICVTPASAQSLRDRARVEGGIASNTADFDTPALSVSEMVTLSDLIVEGTIAAVTTKLVEDDSMVATEYRLVPSAIFKLDASLNTASKPGLLPGIRIVSIGGTVTEGEYRYSTLNSSFPEKSAIKTGEHLIVFLKRHPDIDVYNFTAGPFAVFRVVDGYVRPFTEQVAAVRGDKLVDASSFVRQLKQRVATK